MATMSQTLRPGNITQIFNILNLGNEHVTTNIPLRVARDYVPYIINFDELEIISEQLPGQSEFINGMWIFMHNEEETVELITRVFIRPTEIEDEYYEENEEE